MWYTILKVRLLMIFAPFLGVILWQGMGPVATAYPQSPAEVKSALKKRQVPTHIFGNVVASTKVTERDEETIVTTLYNKDKTAFMLFVTTVKPDGEGSAVSSKIEIADGENKAKAEAAMKQNPVMVGFLERFLNEHVDSAIEGRAFDMLAMNGSPQMELARKHLGEAGLIAPGLNPEAFEEQRKQQYREMSRQNEARVRDQRAENIDRNFGKPMMRPGS